MTKTKSTPRKPRLVSEKSKDAKYAARLHDLERTVSSLKTQVAKRASIAVISTFAPEPFGVRKQIPVVIQPFDDEFIASFFDANINAQGSNETEALENLKDVMLGVFEHLSAQRSNRLGPEPKRQLAVLQEFIKQGD
jgi:predicted RNase H-like HicB family nuclease